MPPLRQQAAINVGFGNGAVPSKGSSIGQAIGCCTQWGQVM
ncbi:hypothetical protein [Microcoleus sp. herbarium12]